MKSINCNLVYRGLRHFHDCLLKSLEFVNILYHQNVILIVYFLLNLFPTLSFPCVHTSAGKHIAYCRHLEVPRVVNSEDQIYGDNPQRSEADVCRAEEGVCENVCVTEFEDFRSHANRVTASMEVSNS